MKYDPDVSAGEFDGIVNLSELAPDALTLVSKLGGTAPAKLPGGSVPELLPNPPTISAALSNPTHFTTPG